MLAPLPGGLAPPPTRNPGSTPVVGNKNTPQVSEGHGFKNVNADNGDLVKLSFASFGSCSTQKTSVIISTLNEKTLKRQLRKCEVV